MKVKYQSQKRFPKKTVAIACTLALSCHATTSLSQTHQSPLDQGITHANISAPTTAFIYTGDKSELVSHPLGIINKGIAPKDADQYSHSNNTLTIEFTPSVSKDNVPNFVFGGFAYQNINSGTVDLISENNHILFNQGAVNGEVYGGYTYAIAGYGATATAVTRGNSVLLNDIQVAGNVYGGYARARGDVAATVSDNRVVINGEAQIAKNIYGGYVRNYAYSSYQDPPLLPAIVTHNSVIIDGTTRVNGDVFGGYANITANQAVSTVAHNTVTIDGGARVDGNIYGGYSVIQMDIPGTGARAMDIPGTGARAKVNNYSNYSLIQKNIATATDNSVIINDAVIGQSVYGGYAYIFNQNAIANNNDVTLMGNTTVGANIYGGQAIAVLDSREVDIKANSNTVNLNNSASVFGHVYGGFAQLDLFSTINSTISMAATHNTLNINDEVTFSSGSNIYGGYLASSSGAIYNNLKESEYSFDVFTGNTLNFNAHPVVINKMANFEHYNFTIDPALANASTALIHANEIVLGSNETNVSTKDVNPSKIQVIGIRSGRELMAGDRFILMNADRLSGAGEGISTKGVAQQGISLLYDVTTTVDLANNQVIATIPDDVDLRSGHQGRKGGSVARVNPKLITLSEGRLAGLALTLQGSDLVAEQSGLTCNEEQGAYCVFGTLSGSSSRYNTGSHIDLDSASLLGGVRYQPEGLPNLTLGVFAENGWGSYDTYNSFYNALPVHGKGHSRYYGIGMLGQYVWENGLYAQSSLRTGKTKTTFDAKDLMSAEGLWANYDNKSSYTSAHLGIGYKFDLNKQNALDLSTKYLWTRIGGNNKTIAGDPIHFDALNSQRIRVMGQWDHKYSAQTTFNAALGGEYEMDSKAKGATYHIHQIDTPDLKGGTGILSLGANFKPNPKANGTGFSMDVKTDAYTGKREGFGGSVRLNYTF